MFGFVCGSLLRGGPFLCPVFWPDVERGQWGKTCLLKVDDLGPLAAGTSVLDGSDPPLTLRLGCVNDAVVLKVPTATFTPAVSTSPGPIC